MLQARFLQLDVIDNINNGQYLFCISRVFSVEERRDNKHSADENDKARRLVMKQTQSFQTCGWK